MRDSCIDCVIKHVMAADIYVHESKFGYPAHADYAIGELYHAEREICRLSMPVALEIRDIRKRIEAEEDADFNVAELRARVLAVEDAADIAAAEEALAVGGAEPWEKVKAELAAVDGK